MKITSRSIIGLLVAMGMVFAGIGSADAQTPTAADADFNGNGEVDIPDFLQFVDAYGTQTGDPNYDAKFDLDNNGVIGIPDFLAFVDLYGETVPAPALELTEIVPAEGMPGALIDLVGRFDVNTIYQVKFDAVLLPVYAQNAERITAMVPVLESGSVSVRVVGAAGRESAPKSFEVQALPEPRMNAEQLQQTVSDVGVGIGNALAPVIEAGVIPSGADAALFNREMGKLNAAWGVLGERIEALPPEDAAMLTHLLDNSGALEILEALARTDLSASKVVADSRFADHHDLFQVDIVSAMMGYVGDLTTAVSVAAFFTPDPTVTKAAGVLLGTAGTIITVSKATMDSFIPTDLQGVSKVEISPTPVPVGGTSDVMFFGNFSTESDLASELASEGFGRGIEAVVKLVIKKKVRGGDALLENELLDDALGQIIGYFSGILSAVGLEETGLQKLFAKVERSRDDVPLDMSLYRLSPPNIIKWAIPSFPDGVIRALEKPFSILNLISESVEVVDSRDVENSEVAEYDSEVAQLKGIKAGEMRLKVSAFRFVEPGGENKSIWGNLWDFVKNLHPLVRFFDSMDRLPPVYWDISVGDTTSVRVPLVVESIRRLTDHEADDFDPTWSPDGRHIAFTSYRDDNWEIYVMDSDGGNLRNLTNHESEDIDPAWSRDGRHIAFVSGRDRNWDIYVMGSDGSNPRRLTTHGAEDRSPSWSPNGQHIAFTTRRDRNYNIYVMGSDGSDLQRLTHGNDIDPAWSPDGQHIAFVSDRIFVEGEYRKQWDIFVKGSDGNNLRNLTEHDKYNKREPAWSPDGQYIAFVNASATLLTSTYRFTDIYVMGSDGSNARNLTLPDYSIIPASPAWSPDGRHIALTGARDGNRDIYVIKLQDDSGGTVIGGSVESDRAALVALYKATNGPGWGRRDGRVTIERFPWLSEKPLYDWYGVATWGVQGRVRALDLSDMQLTGPIPKELGNLTDLEILDLSRNQLTGPIPKELGNLTNLRSLRLSGNQLTGPIPAELGNLTNIVWLDLSGNQLTGPIPEWLGNLTNLRELNLSGNQLTGPIPEWLGNLTNLRWLILSGNQLTGPIPKELGNLTNLTILELNHNQLTGQIPPKLGNLTKLWEVNLRSNQSLCIPADFPRGAFYDGIARQLPACP